MLIYLLENKRIDGAVITRMSKQKPWLTEPFIATTREEILEGAQSKYIITSVNEILDQSSGFKGRLAYVGLPGQVQSIRKLQHAGDPSVANIRLCLWPLLWQYTSFFLGQEFSEILRGKGLYGHSETLLQAWGMAGKHEG